MIGGAGPRLEPASSTRILVGGGQLQVGAGADSLVLTRSAASPGSALSGSCS